MKVFILHHTHELRDGEEDVKLVGVYSTEEIGRKAIAALATQPGFAEHLGGFELSSYELDETNWIAGFVAVPPGHH
jgi:hypothetical protein